MEISSKGQLSVWLLLWSRLHDGSATSCAQNRVDSLDGRVGVTYRQRKASKQKATTAEKGGGAYFWEDAPLPLADTESYLGSFTINL